MGPPSIQEYKPSAAEYVSSVMDAAVTLAMCSTFTQECDI